MLRTGTREKTWLIRIAEEELSLGKNCSGKKYLRNTFNIPGRICKNVIKWTEGKDLLSYNLRHFPSSASSHLIALPNQDQCYTWQFSYNFPTTQSQVFPAWFAPRIQYQVHVTFGPFVTDKDELELNENLVYWEDWYRTWDWSYIHAYVTNWKRNWDDNLDEQGRSEKVRH